MSNACRFGAVVIIVSCSFAALAPAEEFVVSRSDVVKTLDKGHPRLMLKDKGLQSLKAGPQDASR